MSMLVDDFDEKAPRKHCWLQRQPARGGTARPRGLVDLAEAAWRRCKIDKRIRKGESRSEQ